jgi:hypothetical protein
MSWLVPTEFFRNAGCRVYRMKADKAAAFRQYLSKHMAPTGPDVHDRLLLTALSTHMSRRMRTLMSVGVGGRRGRPRLLLSYVGVG